MKSRGRSVRPDGISLFGHRYWADELALHVGEKVNVRYSPDEVGRILVFRGRRFLCEAFAEKLYTFNASEAELKAIQARQRAGGADRHEGQGGARGPRRRARPRRAPLRAS